MLFGRRPWREELAIIDRTMKAISGVTDPEELVTIYWENIGELLPIRDYLAVSRRNEPYPYYVLTRSSQFTEDINPWEERHRLPRMSGGLVGEIVYGNKPVIIDDLAARLTADDPAYAYLRGFKSLIALPQYDDGEGLNVTLLLIPPGVEIDPMVIPLLHWQSGLFGRGTQNLVLRNQLASALAALDRELQIVGDIQRSLLPRELPSIPGLELAAYYNTSARAGGDYYDFFPLDNVGTGAPGWGIFIADVSGHGTPAAVLMAITHALAHAQPGRHVPPSALLKHLNEQLTRSYTHAGAFVTAFYAVLDPVARTLLYARAGHDAPLIARGGEIISLNGNGSPPLGITDTESFEESTITLEPGDLLLLYTDGITEAAAPPSAHNSQELFGIERLQKLLLECRSTTAQGCIDRICAAVATFSRNAPPADDQTVLAICCLA